MSTSTHVHRITTRSTATVHDRTSASLHVHTHDRSMVPEVTLHFDSAAEAEQWLERNLLDIRRQRADLEAFAARGTAHGACDGQAVAS